MPEKFPTDAGSEPDAAEDTSAPETTIIVAPDANSADNTPSFEFSSDDPEAGFLCVVDGGALTPCESPHTLNLPDGAHVFGVRAVDAAGNQDPSPAEHTWVIDTVAPQTSITAAPPALDNSASGAMTFSADEAGATFECQFDGGGFAACTSPRGYGPLGDGAHAFSVRAVDAAGTVDATPATHAWIIDTSTPDTAIDSGPTGVITDTMAAFTFSSPDAGTGATFECSLDGGSFAVCTSPRTYASIAEGPHTFAVRVRNAAGTADPTPATRGWSVDLTPPDTTISSAPAGAVASASAIIGFSSSEAGSTFECSVDSGGFSPCTSPHPVNALSQGPHTFRVRAIDAAGHIDPTPAAASWTVDTIAPDTTIASGPSALTDETTAMFDFSSNETGVAFECSLDGAPFVACTDPVSLSVGDGSHQLVVRAVDAAGNSDMSPAQRAWTVDTTAPVVTITSGPSSTAPGGPRPTFEFTVSEPATTTCAIDGGTPIGCTSPFSLNLPAGVHSIAVEAVDGVGLVGSDTESWTTICGPQNAGPGAFAVFHLDETFSPLESFQVGGGVVGGVLGRNSQSEPNDPYEPTTAQPGRFGRAPLFNHASSDVITASVCCGGMGTNDFAIELWFTPAGGPAYQSLFSMTNQQILLDYRAVAGGIVVEVTAVNPAGGASATAVSPVVPASGWHHVVGSFDGTTISAWLDGNEGTTVFPIGTGSAYHQFEIGANAIAGRAFAGKIDEVVIANRGWTSSEVLARYCPPPVSAPSCPAAYSVAASQSADKYRLVSTPADWATAAADCADDLPGWTYLHVPNNLWELSDSNSTYPTAHWIGVHDQLAEGQWANVLGNSQHYLSWGTGEPNGGDSADCVTASNAVANADEDCMASRQYLCECSAP